VSERTITMTDEGLDSLRTGIITVRAEDSEGRPVVLFPRGAWFPDRSAPNLSLSAVLSFADMDLIESEPEGLVVADVTGTTGWAIRMDRFR
jgi:hypothetical protein